MNLGGIVGEVTYAGGQGGGGEGEQGGWGAGGLGAFLPLLRLGELVHVGKAAVFGNGRYELKDEGGRMKDEGGRRKEEGGRRKDDG